MPKLTIMRGLSGSGKSTWADAQVNTIVVSRDALRGEYFRDDGPDYYKHPMLRQREDFITTVEHAAVKNALKAGFDVISDNTYIETRYMKDIVKIAYSVGATVEVKVIEVPLHLALSRNAFRAKMGGRNVPETTIRKQHDRFQHTKNAAVPSPDPVPVLYSGTPGKPKAFLFDLDGTCFHMNGKRSPYAHNVDVDDPDPVILDIVLRLQNSGLAAVAMSGREEVTRDLTMEALDVNHILPDDLFMRPTKDMRKDSIVKAELFDNYVRDNYDVQFVLDDRRQVVEMWRSMGLKCLQVQEGDF